MSDKENINYGNDNSAIPSAFEYNREYNMMNEKRGIALIFNHEVFANPHDYGNRRGTNVDCGKLVDTLTALHFNVEVHNNFRLGEIMHRMEEVSKNDYTDHDCILIAILSHGSEGHNISAHDSEYNLASIFPYFTDKQCPTLKGKPKLFFIQACQGVQLDRGITLEHGFEHTTNDHHRDPEFRLKKGFIGCYNIIVPSDFLIAYSTISGFYSWRNPTNGSWFIQTLCEKLASNGKKQDILTLLTLVNQNVAMDYSSNNPDDTLLDKNKQIPCIITTLTRILKFTDK